MKVLVSGATGFIGSTLVQALLQSGHQLFVLVRSFDKHLVSCIRQYTVDTLIELEEELDVFINLAGESIASRPWTDRRKKSLYNSRVRLTRVVREQLPTPPRCIVSMSAIGFYGNSGNEKCDENTPPKSGFVHDLCAAWESEAESFRECGSRVIIFRLGMVLGAYGGILKKMRFLYLLGLGGKIGSGDQWFSWVHEWDVIAAIFLAIQDDSFKGVYNLTSPNHIKQKEFSYCYAHSLKRPSVLTFPCFFLKAVFGDMSSLLTAGSKVYPKRLIESGFRFCYENIDDALEEIASRLS